MGFEGSVPATCCLPVAEGPEGLCSGCVGSRRGLASEVGHLGVCGLRHFPAVAQAVGPSLGGGWSVLPPSLLSLHGLTPSSLLLQTPPPALNPDLGIPLPHMSHGHHKSPALSPPLRLALASAPVLGRYGVTWDSCVFHCSEVTWGSGQIKAPPTDTALCVHASVYPCRSLWSKCQAVLSLGTGQLWVASVFPHIIL